MKIGYRLPENNYSQQAIDFMDKVLDISGLGDATFLSDGAPAPCRHMSMLPGSHTHAVWEGVTGMCQGCLLSSHAHAAGVAHACCVEGPAARCHSPPRPCCRGDMHGALRGRRMFASDVMVPASRMPAARRHLGLRLPVCARCDRRLRSCLMAVSQLLRCSCQLLRRPCAPCRCGAGP